MSAFSLRISVRTVPSMLTWAPGSACSNCFRKAPSLRETMAAGIWGTGVVPSWPGADGSPATLLTISTPMAPACSALRTLVVKVQLPRSTSAIFPATSAAFTRG